jgi:hypothetical protein
LLQQTVRRLLYVLVAKSQEDFCSEETERIKETRGTEDRVCKGNMIIARGNLSGDLKRK